MNSLHRILAKRTSLKFVSPTSLQRSSPSSCYYFNTGPTIPQPKVIPFQAKVANSVSLIGHVKAPIRMLDSPDGLFWAGTIISQGYFSTSFWIPIIFRGDLAHFATHHLKENDHIQISGELSAELPPFDDAKIQVMVHSFNFLQGSYRKKKNQAVMQQEEISFKDFR